jgi:TolA-binding protein
MKNLICFLNYWHQRSKVKSLFILFVFLNFQIFGDNPITVQSKTEKTSDGFVFRVIAPSNLPIDRSTPVFYLFSYNFEGKPLEEEYLKIMASEKIVLVVIEGFKELNGIGQIRKIYLDILAVVQSNYLVHKNRNYITGNLEGAEIGSAVAKWVDKEVAGVVLFDGFHSTMHGHPNLLCPIFAFAKSDSKEIRAIKSLKEKYEDINKDFNIIEYDNKVGLPKTDAINKVIIELNEKWARANEDNIQINLALRQAIADRESKNIEALFKANQLEEVYEQIEKFNIDFSSTKLKKILAQLEKNQVISNKIAGEISVKAFVDLKNIMREFKERELNYKFLVNSIDKLKGVISNYPQTNSAKKAEIEIKKIQEIIFNRKLNVENKNELLVVNDYMKFMEESTYSETVKSTIINEFKKAEASKDYSDLIMNTLVLLNKDYANGLLAFSSEKMNSAEKYFDKILPENNLYLKAYQLYYLARIKIIKDDYESAEEILNDFLKVNLNYTTHQADAFFLLAVCYYNQFKRDKAKAILENFEKRFPNAPERMIVGAYQLLNKIDLYEEGSLSDVEERMEYSKRKLKNADIDKPTIDNQDRVITLLDKLIKESEQNEQNQRNKNKSKRKTGSKSGDVPTDPAEQSEAPEGESKIGQLKRINRGNRDEEWGKERDKEREKIMNALKEKFPERYRELIEQYYKGLQKNED